MPGSIIPLPPSSRLRAVTTPAVGCCLSGGQRCAPEKCPVGRPDLGRPPVLARRPALLPVRVHLERHGVDSLFTAEAVRRPRLRRHASRPSACTARSSRHGEVQQERHDCPHRRAGVDWAAARRSPRATPPDVPRRPDPPRCVAVAPPCGSAPQLAQGAALAERATWPKTEEYVLLPPPGSAPLLALGYRELAADVSWAARWSTTARA